MNSSNFEVVNSHELNNGDVVAVYGNLFKLSNARYWDNQNSACVSFDAEWVGMLYNGMEPIKNYDCVQGNEKARHARLVK